MGGFSSLSFKRGKDVVFENVEKEQFTKLPLGGEKEPAGEQLSFFLWTISKT